jgi:hypothetical protein
MDLIPIHTNPERDWCKRTKPNSEFKLPQVDPTGSTTPEIPSVQMTPKSPNPVCFPVEPAGFKASKSIF